MSSFWSFLRAQQSVDAFSADMAYTQEKTARVQAQESANSLGGMFAIQTEEVEKLERVVGLWAARAKALEAEVAALMREAETCPCGRHHALLKATEDQQIGLNEVYIKAYIEAAREHRVSAEDVAAYTGHPRRYVVKAVP